jgi:hypothetical protein
MLRVCMGRIVPVAPARRTACRPEDAVDIARCAAASLEAEVEKLRSIDAAILGPFVSGRKIPFPGNKTPIAETRVRMPTGFISRHGRLRLPLTQGVVKIVKSGAKRTSNYGVPSRSLIDTTSFPLSPLAMIIRTR